MDICISFTWTFFPLGDQNEKFVSILNWRNPCMDLIASQRASKYWSVSGPLQLTDNNQPQESIQQAFNIMVVEWFDRTFYLWISVAGTSIYSLKLPLLDTYHPVKVSKYTNPTVIEAGVLTLITSFYSTDNIPHQLHEGSQMSYLCVTTWSLETLVASSRRCQWRWKWYHFHPAWIFQVALAWIGGHWFAVELTLLLLSTEIDLGLFCSSLHQWKYSCVDSWSVKNYGVFSFD